MFLLFASARCWPTMALMKSERVRVSSCFFIPPDSILFISSSSSASLLASVVVISPFAVPWLFVQPKLEGDHVLILDGRILFWICHNAGNVEEIFFVITSYSIHYTKLYDDSPGRGIRVRFDPISGRGRG